MSEKITIAKINSSHGVKGLVKITFFGENISLFDNPVFIDNKEHKIHIKGKSKNQIIIEIERFVDKTSSDLLKNKEIKIDKNNLPKLNDDEIYHIDIIGLSASSPSGENLGVVVDIQNFGASDLIEVKPEKGSSFFIPWTKECVKEISDTQIIIDEPEMI